MFIISIIYSPFHRPRQVKQPFFIMRYGKQHISKKILTTKTPESIEDFRGGQIKFKKRDGYL